MTSQKKLLLALVACFAAGTALVVDALTHSDRDKLDRFASSLVEERAESRVDAALRLADLTREPVELVYEGKRASFAAGKDAGLARDLHRALAAFEAERLDVVQRAVQIDGETARVAVRLRTEEGFVNALFHLAKSGDDWLLRRVAVTA